MTLQLYPKDQGNHILWDVSWHTGATSLSPETSAPPLSPLLYVPCKQDELSLSSEEHPMLHVGGWDRAGALSPAVKHLPQGPRQGWHPRDSCNSMLSQNSLAGPLMHMFCVQGLESVGWCFKAVEPSFKIHCGEDKSILHQRRQFPEDQRM